MIVSFLVELSRESCRSPNSSPWDPIKTRLFSKSQQRYLCFNRRGRVRSVVSFAPQHSATDQSICEILKISKKFCKIRLFNMLDFLARIYLIKEFSSKVPLIVNPVALSNPNTCTYHFTRKSCKCKSLMPLFELSWGGRCSHNSHPGGVPGVVSHILIWDKTWNSKRNGRLNKSLENK